ncbi:ABC transporter substrate-binding protein [Streptomyces paludis]|uniref:ABC transporter substrate-binding protein n=1 Tax=Streptomyces paludis TaxID=2282738 RepID=A0A345HU95_9ACTN|nr:ABC transporter substrate-binding protein [Streptomyces paludis]AXG80269.1 ABC transporter substrate-binding protein [Streptomyces paludis]
MRSVRRRRLAAGLLLTPLLAPLLSGCFASGPDSSGTSSAKDSAKGSADGKRLRVALAFPPAENLSPYGADATLLSRLGVTEGLTRLDGNGAAAPSLAESWTRENSRSWLFTLRDARFQDGTAVTAEAAAASLTHAAAATPIPSALTGVTLTAEAAGEGRVRVTTAKPDPVLPLRLAGPSLAVLSQKAYGKDGKATPIATATGPFELTKVNGSTSATLDRFDDYWGGRAQASGIDAKFIADGTARANALRSGEEDIAEAVPVAQAASLAQGTAREVPTSRTTSLLLNTRSGPFADPAVRAAARAALDTSVLAKNVFEGHADPGQGIFGPALSWAAGKRVAPVGRAKAASAGAVKGTTVSLATYDNRPELPEVAQVLQQQLEKAGFTVKLTVREYSRLESDALAGKFDAVVAARNTMLDTGDPVSILASDYTCDGTYNLARLCDKAVDKAVAAADATADPAKRQDAAMAAEARILGADAVVPLVHQRNIVGVADAVRGVVLDPYERALVATGTRR